MLGARTMADEANDVLEQKIDAGIRRAVSWLASEQKTVRRLVNQ